MSGKEIKPSKLIAAIREGRLNAVLDALDDGCDIEEADMHGQRGLPLRTACFSANLAIIRELLIRGADINAAGSDGPCAPLRLAVRCKHEEVVSLLLEQGADIPEGLEIDPQLGAPSNTEEAPPPKLEIPSLPFERVAIPTAPSETSADVDHTGESIDIPGTFGTDTNLLTMELLRLGDDQDPPPRPLAPRQGFWKTNS